MSDIPFRPGGLARPPLEPRFSSVEQLSSGEKVAPLPVLEACWADNGSRLADWTVENGFPWPSRGE